MKPPTLDDYDKLFSLYGKNLNFNKEDSNDWDLSLIFEQIIRLLIIKSDFNRNIPRPFIFIAKKYESAEPAINKHFQYKENHKFFLSDLYDFIQIQKFKKKMNSRRDAGAQRKSKEKM